ncbi:hypothetical protein BC834DRAFT_858745 [Gloeopeniophorella convolvens]|nr:hypothetical protein BC834DRAFT_858745 [Gloeopeniophorella convolvens]
MSPFRRLFPAISVLPFNRQNVLFFLTALVSSAHGAPSRFINDCHHKKLVSMWVYSFDIAPIVHLRHSKETASRQTWLSTTVSFLLSHRGCLLSPIQ